MEEEDTDGYSENKLCENIVLTRVKHVMMDEPISNIRSRLIGSEHVYSHTSLSKPTTEPGSNIALHMSRVKEKLHAVQSHCGELGSLQLYPSLPVS